MNDYRLQFADEAAWWAAAASEGWVHYEYAPQTVEPDQEPPEPVIINSWLATPGIDFDVIGAIYKPTGNLINDAPEMAQVPGFHVNVRMHSGVLPESLNANRVMPAQPVRTFAGGWFEGL
jgi:hypothetical protein